MDNLTVITTMISNYAPVAIASCVAAPAAIAVCKPLAKELKKLNKKYNIISFDYEDPTLNSFGDEEDEW